MAKIILFQALSHVARQWQWVVCIQKHTAMKTSVKVFILVFIILMGALSAISSFAATPGDAIDVVNSKHENLFVFRADRGFIGASVTIYAANGEVVTKSTLTKRKMIIDFCDVKHGAYKIVVAKGKYEEEFKFIRG